MQVPETLDFSPILDNGQPSPKRARVSGEFEVADLNDFHGLHAATTSKPKPTVNQESQVYTLMRQGTNVANIINIITNGLSALVNSSTGKKKHEWINKSADFGAKLSMGVNSIFNIYNGHKQKEFFNVAGYLSELLIALLAPYKIMGLLRGVAFTLYQIPNLVTSTGHTPKSETYTDNLKMIQERIGIALKKTFSSEAYKFKNLSGNFGLLSGTWGGILSGAGILSWLLTGSTKIGSFIKGIGEILLDSFQLSKDHWLCKRTHYINSGLSFILGSLCEMISKQKNNEPVTMALYFVGSGIGRMFMTWSNTAKEREYQPGGPKATVLAA